MEEKKKKTRARKKEKKISKNRTQGNPLKTWHVLGSGIRSVRKEEGGRVKVSRRSATRNEKHAARISEEPKLIEGEHKRTFWGTGGNKRVLSYKETEKTWQGQRKERLKTSYRIEMRNRMQRGFKRR